MSKKELAKKEMSEVPANEMSEAEMLISKAIDKNVPVETMEKLLAMRRELKQEWAKEQYNKALAEFQAECPEIQKVIQVYDKYGKPRYKYAPLDEIIKQVKGLLKKHGFSYSFNARFEDGAQIITCTARHISGHSETAEFRSPIDKDAYMTEIQKHGAAMTYAKRYAFCQVFGIMTTDEDTDGITPEENNNNKEAKEDMFGKKEDVLKEIKKYGINKINEVMRKVGAGEVKDLESLSLGRLITIRTLLSHYARPKSKPESKPVKKATATKKTYSRKDYENMIIDLAVEKGVDLDDIIQNMFMVDDIKQIKSSELPKLKKIVEDMKVEDEGIKPEFDNLGGDK